ncbi:MAG: efflux RND transporter permease subunit, partial [Pseudomonadota bacterium]
PFLCTRLLKPKKEKAGTKHPLIEGYGVFIRRLLPFGIPVVLVTFGLVAFSATQFGRLKSEMFPLSERTDFLIYMDMPKGTAISETEAYASAVQDWLSDETVNPGIENSTIYVGDGGPRFYLALSPADPDPASAFFVVNATDFETAVETAERARRTFIEEFPAARFRVTRLSMGGSESGIVDVEVTGPDADVLLAASAELEAAFNALPDLTKNESNWGNKVLKVVVDIAQDRAREFGVTSQEISEVMDAYFSGTAYSTFREGDEQIPIVLRATTSRRDSIEDLANLSIAANGELISIDQVASFQPKLEYSEIRRENQVRQITVSAKSASLPANQVVERIQPTLDGLELGDDYEVKIAGELEDSVEVYSKIGANLPLALAVMLTALIFQFNSVRRSLITFMTIPIILVGAPYALLLSDRPMSFFAVLGLMSLMGIIINNAIVLINQIDLDRENMPLVDAIVHASQQRARPIMLTSLTTIFGLLPMALNGGALFEPMATIMIGGLLVASPLTLIFVPGVCYFLMRDKPRPETA